MSTPRHTSVPNTPHTPSYSRYSSRPPTRGSVGTRFASFQRQPSLLTREFSSANSLYGVEDVIPKQAQKWLKRTVARELLPLPQVVKDATQKRLPRPVPPKGQSAPTSQYACPDPVDQQSPVHGKHQCYYLRIERVSGIRIPKDIRDKYRLSDMSFQYSISLFHDRTKTFFGTTWRSESIPIVQSPEEIQHDTHVYYHSSLSDDTCFGVVELILQVHDKGVVVERFGLGWTTLPLFHLSSQLLDIATLEEDKKHDGIITQGRSHKPERTFEQSRHMFPGSPIALTFTKPETALSSNLQTTTTNFHFSLFVNSNVSLIQHLFRENELVGVRNTISGLPIEFPRKHLPSDPRSHLFRACVRDRFPTTTITVSSVAISLPTGFEAKLLANLAFLRQRMWLPSTAEVKKRQDPLQELSRRTVEEGRVLSRILRIGVHNGRCFVKQPIDINLEKQDADHTLPDLMFNGAIAHEVMIDARKDSDLVVFFELIYIVQWSIPKHSNAPAANTITVGWTVRNLDDTSSCQFDGSAFLLSLSRAPGRTLTSNLVYCADEFINEETESKKNVGGASLQAGQPLSVQISLYSEELMHIREEGYDPEPDRLVITPPQTAIQVTEPVSPRHEPPPADATPAKPAISQQPIINSAKGFLVGVQPDHARVSRQHTGFDSIAPSASFSGREHIDLTLEVNAMRQESSFGFKICGFQPPAAMIYTDPSNNPANAPPTINYLKFTFHFFNRAPFISDPVEVMWREHPHMANPSRDQDGFFDIDLTFSCVVPPAAQTDFIPYLYTKDLFIDVWDGESQFYLGTVNVPLHRFLRQGQPRVQHSAVYPISTSMFMGGSYLVRSDLDMHQSAHLDTGTIVSSRTLGDRASGGRLKIKVIHAGKQVSEDILHQLNMDSLRSIPTTVQSTYLLQALQSEIIDPSNPQFSMIDPSLLRDVSPTSSRQIVSINPLSVAVNREIGKKRKVKAQKLVDLEPRLRPKLKGKYAVAGVMEEALTEAKLRAHTQAISRRGRTNVIVKPSSHRETPDLMIRQANLKQIKQYRREMRDQFVFAELRKSMLHSRAIHPSFGQLVFFELKFTNPYSHEAKFTIQIRDPSYEQAKQSESALDDQSKVDRFAAPELEVVVDTNAWSYYKKLYGLKTPVRRGAFEGAEVSSPTSTPLTLGPNETIHIPIKFQSFAAGHVVSQEYKQSHAAPDLAFPVVDGVLAQPQYTPISQRQIQLSVENSESTPVAILELDVVPKPFTTDKIYRLHHWQHEIMRFTISLPTPSLGGSQQAFPAPLDNSMKPVYRPRSHRQESAEEAARREAIEREGLKKREALRKHQIQCYQANLNIEQRCSIARVRCTSDDVAIEFRDDGVGGSSTIHTQATGLQESNIYHSTERPPDFGEVHSSLEPTESHTGQVQIRCTVPSSPNILHFYLLLYSDIYSCTLAAVYEVYVHGHLRADMAAVVGQHTTGTLLMPPTSKKRRVAVAASVPYEFTFGLSGIRGRPSEIFELVPDRPNELSYVFTTSAAGQRNQLVHLIDVDSHELVESWLLFVNASYPQVDSTQHVQLNVGESVFRKMSYRNNYNVQKTFHLHSSDTNLLEASPPLLSIPPRGMKTMEFEFVPQRTPGTQVVFLFVTDDGGKIDQCLKFVLTYVSS